MQRILRSRSVFRCHPDALFSTQVDPLASPATPLVFDRPFYLARPEVEKSFFGRLLLRFSGYYGKDSKRRRGANNLFDAICEQAKNAPFYKVMDLNPDTFAAVHNVLGLHMWLVIRRLHRLEDQKNAKKLTQLVYDQFLHDIELRVHRLGVRVRRSRESAGICGALLGSGEGEPEIR